MNLKPIHNTCKSVSAFIVLRSNGSSYFSKKLADEMQLQHNDCFNILNDEDRPVDYYLAKTDQGIKVKVYECKNRRTRQFHARSLARNFGRFFSVDHRIIKIPVGPKTTIQGVEYWPMITESLNKQ